MINITYVLFLNMALNTPHASTVASLNVDYLDTVPIEKIIPYKEDSTVHHSRKEKFLNNLSKIMGLHSLHENNGGISIRIWLWEFGEHYVIDISKAGTQYASSAISWNSKKIGDSEYIIIHKKWSVLKPKSGWSQFFKTLDKYQILNLKSGLPLEKHDDHLTHASYVQFEIEQAGSYRYYEYLEPSFYRFVESGSNKVYRFLKYYNQQMSIEVYTPPDNLFESKKRISVTP